MRATPLSGGLLVVALACGIALASPQTNPAPGEAPTIYQTGLAAFKRGDLPAAREAFTKAVELNPRNVDAQNMLGQVLLQQGDVDNAIVHFRVLVGLRPSLAIGHAYLAQALETKGRIDEAITEFRIAVQFAP